MERLRAVGVELSGLRLAIGPDATIRDVERRLVGDGGKAGSNSPMGRSGGCAMKRGRVPR